MNLDLCVVTQREAFIALSMFPAWQRLSSSLFLMFIPSTSPGTCISIATASLFQAQHYTVTSCPRKELRGSDADFLTPLVKVLFPNTYDPVTYDG